ncbi:MAG: hypothetical protein H0W88_00150 [Parachlamydiaceae bacterium]|nr:hypothetical protein [Parachlamydiaceae bacterium]
MTTSSIAHSGTDFNQLRNTLQKGSLESVIEILKKDPVLAETYWSKIIPDRYKKNPKFTKVIIEEFDPTKYETIWGNAIDFLLYKKQHSWIDENTEHWLETGTKVDLFKVMIVFKKIQPTEDKALVFKQKFSKLSKGDQKFLETEFREYLLEDSKEKSFQQGKKEIVSNLRSGMNVIGSFIHGLARGFAIHNVINTEDPRSIVCKEVGIATLLGVAFKTFGHDFKEIVGGIKDKSSKVMKETSKILFNNSMNIISSTAGSLATLHTFKALAGEEVYEHEILIALMGTALGLLSNQIIGFRKDSQISTIEDLQAGEMESQFQLNDFATDLMFGGFATSLVVSSQY